MAQFLPHWSMFVELPSSSEAAVRPVLALIVFCLDLWALATLLGSPLPRSRKLAWAAAIVFIPVGGFLLWLRASRRSTGALTRS